MSLPDSPAPTRARFVLAGWLCGLSAVLYLDRLCLAQAVDPIQDELGLSNTEMSYVAMAFTLSYGLLAVAVGRLGDRFGSRAVLTAVVLAWSAFTGLTGAATGLLMLLVVRFLFGAAEAGAYPNAARILPRWFPVTERGRVQGFMLASAQLGAVVTPVAAAYLIQLAGWRWMFAGFALIGCAWAVGFWVWFRDDPATHPRVTQAELAEIHAASPPPAADPGPVPWGVVFVNRGVLVLSMIMVFSAFYTYFFYTWFQKYLQDGHGVTNVETGWMASLVMAGSAVGMLAGGWLADQIPRWTSDHVRARRWLGTGCYLSAAVFTFAAIRCGEPWALAGCFCVAFLLMHITLPNWWSCAIPQGGRHVGALFGLMNGIGVFGAMASQGFVGIFADWQASRGLSGRAQWDPIFDVYVLSLVCAAVGWWLYRLTPLQEPPLAAEPEVTW